MDTEARIAQAERRLDTTERNLSDHERLFTAHNEVLERHEHWMRTRETQEAVEAEAAKATIDWRKRVEARIDGIYSMGKWAGGGFGLLIIAALANLILK